MLLAHRVVNEYSTLLAFRRLMRRSRKHDKEMNRGSRMKTESKVQRLQTGVCIMVHVV